MASRPPRPPKNTTPSSIASVIIDTIPPTAEPFHFAVGFGITSWQNVEKGLCEVFLKVSTCRDTKVAAAMFYSPIDFSEKLRLTRNAARLSLAKSPLLKDWEKLKTRLQNASDQRNNLAHFDIVHQIQVGKKVVLALVAITKTGDFLRPPSQEAGEQTGVYLLQPNASDPNEEFKKHRKETKKPMRIEDILNAQHVFSSLATDLNAFSAKIPPL